MSKCCIICYTLCSPPGESDSGKIATGSGSSSGQAIFGTDWDNKTQKTLEKFFTLLGRHLHLNNNDGDDKLNKIGGHQSDLKQQQGKAGKNERILEFPVGRIIEAGMTACGDCLRTMESFCDGYHRMKTMELELNWKVWSVNNVMLKAEEVSAALKNFQQSDNGGDVGENVADLIIDFKKKLIRKCSERLRNSFPKVSIRRHRRERGKETQRKSSKKNANDGSVMTDVIEGILNGEADDFLFDDDHAADDDDAISFMDYGDTDAITYCEPAGDTTTAADFKVFPAPESSLSNQTTGISHIRKLNKSVSIKLRRLKLEPVTLARIKMETLEMTNEGQESEGPHDATENLSEIENMTYLTQEQVKKEESSGTSNAIIPVIALSSSNTGPPDPDSNDRATSLSRRSLRMVHHCNTCTRTFSTPQTLAEHHTTGTCGLILDGADNTEQMHADDADDDYKGNSSDESNSEKMETTRQTRKRTKTLTHEKRKKYYQSSRKNRLSLPSKAYFRFKCPDCNELFLLLHYLLLHREKSHSSQANRNKNDSDSHTPDSSATTSINILLFSKKPISNTICSDHQDNYETFATIEVPTKVYLCQVKSCGEPFYTPEDLKNHSKLHGKFKCKFCSSTKDYAPNLAEHERKHHSKKCDYKHLTPTALRLACARCGTQFTNNLTYINHHLTDHLSLTKNSNACAICKTHNLARNNLTSKCHVSMFKAYSNIREIFVHYKLLHDKRHAVQPIKMRLCKIEDCAAYFLTRRQLNVHRKLRHNMEKDQPVKVPEEWICKDCGKTLAYKGSLQRHRIQYHVEEKDLISCPFMNCPSIFETEEDLKSHSAVHRTKFQKKCSKCGVQFFHESNYFAHMKSKCKSRRPLVNRPCLEKIGKQPRHCYYRFKCPDCNQLFRRVYQLLLHRKELHHIPAKDKMMEETSIEIISNMQGFDVGSLDKVKRFKVVAKVEVPPLQLFSCPFETCQESFYSSEEFENHLKLHGKFSCNFCNVEKDFAPDLSEHELQHGGRKKDDIRNPVWKCVTCQLSLSSKSSYILHHVRIHMSLPFTGEACSICKTYRSPVLNEVIQHYLGAHNLMDVDLKSVHRCVIDGCFAYFTNVKGLTRHRKTFHNIDEEQLKKIQHKSIHCKDCPKRYSTPLALRDHRLRTHVKPNSVHRCPFQECKFVSELEAQLSRHIRLRHSSSEPVINQESNRKECPKCKKYVTVGGAYTVHMRCHKRKEDIEAGLIPEVKMKETFVCELCGKGFKFKIRLERHMLSHSGPDSWEFMCSVCSKKCFSKQKLEDHQRTHTKEKPFVCQVCGQKYAHRHNLRIHVNSKHGDVMEDKARKFDTSNLTPNAGTKRKAEGSGSVKVKRKKSNEGELGGKKKK